MEALNLQEDEKLVILGASGNIAGQFMQEPVIQQAIEKSKLAALFTSELSLLSEHGINITTIDAILKGNKKEERRGNIEKFGGYEYKNKGGIIYACEQLEKTGINPVIIDLSNGNLLEEHLFFNITEKKIIGANKIPLSTGTYEDFNSLVGKNYGAEATVMGGQGIYGIIENNFNAGIPINKIQGVFSGTMGYIMSELEKGRKFSDIIEDAIKFGYTETNPMDDLDGLDVVKKIVILARRAGYDIGINNVDVQGLLDDSYREFFKDGVTEEAKQAFLAKIRKDEDPKYEEIVRKAKEEKKVLRYLAQFVDENGQPKVGVNVQEVLKTSDFGGLSGADNLAILETPIRTSDTNPNQTISLKGPGAGVEVTSSKVLQNLQQILNYR